MFDRKMTNPKMFTYNLNYLCNIDYNSKKPDWMIPEERYRGFKVKGNKIVLRYVDGSGDVGFRDIMAYEQKDRDKIANYLTNNYPRYNF